MFILCISVYESQYIVRTYLRMSTSSRRTVFIPHYLIIIRFVSITRVDFPNNKLVKSTPKHTILHKVILQNSLFRTYIYNITVRVEWYSFKIILFFPSPKDCTIWPRCGWFVWIKWYVVFAKEKCFQFTSYYLLKRSL